MYFSSKTFNHIECSKSKSSRFTGSSGEQHWLPLKDTQAPSADYAKSRQGYLDDLLVSFCVKFCLIMQSSSGVGRSCSLQKMHLKIEMAYANS